jgi:hypothetical protein
MTYGKGIECQYPEADSVQRKPHACPQYAAHASMILRRCSTASRAALG